MIHQLVQDWWAGVTSPMYIGIMSVLLPLIALRWWYRRRSHRHRP